MEGPTQKDRMINYLSNFMEENKTIDMYEFADHMLKQFKKEIKIRKLKKESNGIIMIVRNFWLDYTKQYPEGIPEEEVHRTCDIFDFLIKHFGTRWLRKTKKGEDCNYEK